MRILNGKKLSEEILTHLKKEISARGGSVFGGKSRRLKLKLAVVLIGENQVSKIFINQKKKACEEIGVDFKLHQFNEKISEKELKNKVENIARTPSNSGVVVQLPLPQNIDTQQILNIIPSEKDVDVLSDKSLGRFSQGTLPILPPTVGGISHLLKKYKIKIKGKNIVIVGAGRLVGYPLAIWLLKEKATVSVLNKFTKDTPSFTKKADILVSGAGKPNLIKGDMVKKEAIVIDAGTSMEKGGVVGDVDFKSVSKKASYITPVPGGVGPLTVACLLDNLVKLCQE